MQGLPYADVDYCQYSNWGYKKPTRIWADVVTLSHLNPRLCDGESCPNLNPNPPRHSNGQRKHKIPLSSPHQILPQAKKYRVPPALLEDIIVAEEKGDAADPPLLRTGVVHVGPSDPPPFRRLSMSVPV